MKKIVFSVLLGLNLLSISVFAKDQVIDLQVTEKGFEPSSIIVKPEVPVVLRVTRKTNATCATRLKVQSKNIKKELPLNQSVKIALGSLQKGEIRFGCDMDMITGILVVK